MTFWKMQNYDDSKKISDGQEYAGWWNEGRGIQVFRAMKLFCMIL